MPFILFISFFIAQRISELIVAKKNEKWLRSQGAIEYGAKHYPLIIVVHTTFIASMIAEYFARTDSRFDPSFLSLYIILLFAKIWIIISLGKFWNTRIFRLPDMMPLKRGLYKYFKHPNYFIVACEFIVVPLVFHLFYTMVIFSLLNVTVLSIRIREEDRVWNT